MYDMELQELGLTPNEIKVYMVLLEFGISNPTQLAQKTGLHRSYIYDTLERLLERGVINTILVNNKKHYQPVDPKILKEIYELKLRQLDDILPKLSGLFNATKEETKVELHRGKRVYRTLIKDIMASLKKDDHVLLIGVDEEQLMNEVEPIYLKQYFNFIKEKHIKEKVIIKRGKKKYKIPNVQHRTLEPKFIGDIEQTIYGNKVAIFILGNPHYLIVIESKEVANTYRKQFELLWKIAKK